MSTQPRHRGVPIFRGGGQSGSAAWRRQVRFSGPEQSVLKQAAAKAQESKVIASTWLLTKFHRMV
jgi:hypothetical protein